MTEYATAEIDAAKDAIARDVIAYYGGGLIGAAIQAVNVSNYDAIRYLNGATVADLMNYFV